MPYLFDGYNLYHAAKKFHADWRELPVMALCLMIHGDMKRLRDHAEIVFDGHHPRGRQEKVGDGQAVDLIYSGASEADALIEQYIAENSAPRRMVVVSSDRRIRAAARRRKATSLTAQEYLEAMLKRSARRHRIKDPREKQEGVPEGELTDWLALLGVEDKPDEPDDLHDLIR